MVGGWNPPIFFFFLRGCCRRKFFVVFVWGRSFCFFSRVCSFRCCSGEVWGVFLRAFRKLGLIGSCFQPKEVVSLEPGALAFEDQLGPRLAEHLNEVYGGGGQGKVRRDEAFVVGKGFFSKKKLPCSENNCLTI